ncbi:hypothetical protein Tco_1255654 [Tanacetum coccineum]
MPMATLERRSIVNIESGKRGCRSKAIRKENRKKRREKIPTFKKKAAASNRSLKQRDAASPSKHPEGKGSLDAPSKLTRAKLNKCFGDDNLSKDMSGLESPPELQRSWCVEGHIRFRVISSVLAQRYLRTIRQRYSPCEGPLSLE